MASPREIKEAFERAMENNKSDRDTAAKDVIREKIMGIMKEGFDESEEAVYNQVTKALDALLAKHKLISLIVAFEFMEKVQKHKP